MRKRTTIRLNGALAMGLVITATACSAPPTNLSSSSATRTAAQTESGVQTVIRMNDTALDVSSRRVLAELERVAEAKIKYVRAGALGVHVIRVESVDYNASLERLRKSGLVTFVHQDREVDQTEKK